MIPETVAGCSMISHRNKQHVHELVESKLSSSWGRRKVKPDQELHRRISQGGCSSGSTSPPKDSDNNWTLVVERLASHPHEALVLDGRGRTCLMAAYAKSAPLFVLKALLEKTRFGLETARDKTGMTALMIALQANASLESIELLLTAQGKQQTMTCNHHGRLPLHMVLERPQQISPSFLHHHHNQHQQQQQDQVMQEERCRQRFLTKLMLKTGPSQQVLFENHEGHTPLHIALMHKVPVDIVELLVQECPAVLTKQACGCTPLVSAILYDAPLSCLEYLVAKNPTTTQLKDKDGKYPLRIALEHRSIFPADDIIRLLCTSPEAVRTADSMGRTCLELALEQWSSSLGSVQPAVMETLLATAVTQPSSTAAAPVTEEPVVPTKVYTLDMPMKLCYHYYMSAYHTWERASTSLRSVTHVTISVAEAETTLEKWWLVVKMMIKATAILREPRGDFDQTEDFLLQAALVTNAPEMVIRRILDTYPNSIYHSAYRMEGFPLHAACQLKCRDQERIATTILTAAPTVATWRDAAGRYPLHIVAKLGGGCFSIDFLKSLIQACPEVVSTPDPTLALYPFLSAAASERDFPDDLQKLTTCYQLLVAAPEVLLAL